MKDQKVRWVFRWLLRGVLAMAAAGVGVYLCSGFFLAPIIERQLAAQLDGAAVAVQGARFSGAGILIKGLAVAERKSLLTSAPIFLAERIQVYLSLADLLKGKLVVHLVKLKEAVLIADYEKGRGWNLLRLGFKRPAGQPKTLPLVQIDRSAFRIRYVRDGKPTTLATVSVFGQLVALDEPGAYGFSLGADERFAMTGSRLDGVFRLGQNGQPHTLSMTGELMMGQANILGNCWHLDAIALDCAFDAASLDIGRLTFVMGDGRGSLSGRVELAADGAFDLQTSVSGIPLSDAPIMNAAIYNDTVMELLPAKAAEFLRRFSPRGLSDVQLHLTGRWNAIAQAQVNGRVVCRDMTIQDARFPYALEAMRGEIVFKGRTLTFEGLHCRHNGWELIVQGGVEDFGVDQQVWLRVVSGKIAFDEDVYNALNPAAKRLWFAFSPSGTGAIDYTYRRTPQERTQRLVIDLIDAGAVYAHFPYPLERVSGRLIWEGGRITLDNIVAHYTDSRRVRLTGTITTASGQTPQFAIRIRAEQIPVDARLTDAMPPTQQAFFKQFDMDAVAAVDVAIFPDPTGGRPFDYTAHLQAVGSRLLYAGLPIPLENVRLDADITHQVVDIKSFTASRGAGKIHLSGQIYGDTDTAAPPLCLAIEASGLELDAVFWKAVEKQITHLPPSVRLGGAVDAKGRWSRHLSSEQCEAMEVAVVFNRNPLLIDGASTATVSGNLFLNAGQVRLDNFRIENAAMTAALGKAMPERLRLAYERLGVGGTLDAAIDTATLTLDKQDFGGIEVKGRLALKGVNTRGSDFIAGLDGVVEGRFQLDADEQIQQVDARYTAQRFSIRGRPVENLSGRLTFDPDSGVLTSRDMAAAPAGGIAAGQATLDIRPGDSFLTYTLQASFEGVDVGQMIAPDAPPATEGEHAGQGKAGGMLDLQGQLGQPDAMQGRVEVVSSNMRMGKQTLLGKVLTAVQLRTPQDYVFDRVEANAFIRGDEAVFDRIYIMGNPFVFHGDGRLNLRNNHIAVNLYAMGRLASLEPIILGPLLRTLGATFWKIEITGPVNTPQIRTVSLPILRFPLELFNR